MRELFEREELDVLTLVETFLDTEQGVQLGGAFIVLCNDRVGTRAPGGTAILIRDGIAFKRLPSMIFEQTELVSVQVLGTTVGALYSPPRAAWSGLERALEAFRRLASGKAILLGDFNGRHATWCTKTNARGRKLVEWVDTSCWIIEAPAETTCLNSSGGQSTVDFAIVRSGAVRRVKARRDWREPFLGSDHAPVTLEWWGRCTALRPNDARIPKGRRCEEAITSVAEEWSAQELPWHIEQMKAVTTQEELDKAYSDAVKCVLRPWNRVRAKDRPARWGAFWNRELQRLINRRKTLWKRWRRTGEDEDKARYKEIDRRVKTGARQAKQECFNKFVRELDTTRAHAAVSRMSRMIKARKRRRLQQTQASERIEPATFTAFVANQHNRRVGERRLQRQRFQLDSRWREDVEWAVKVAPRGKTKGIDEVFVEALQESA